jgi:hypothetical protein
MGVVLLACGGHAFISMMWLMYVGNVPENDEGLR